MYTSVLVPIDVVMNLLNHNKSISASAANGNRMRFLRDSLVMQLSMYPRKPLTFPSTTLISSTSCFIIISRTI